MEERRSIDPLMRDVQEKLTELTLKVIGHHKFQEGLDLDERLKSIENKLDDKSRDISERLRIQDVKIGEKASWNSLVGGGLVVFAGLGVFFTILTYVVK